VEEIHLSRKSVIQVSTLKVITIEGLISLEVGTGSDLIVRLARSSIEFCQSNVHIIVQELIPRSILARWVRKLGLHSLRLQTICYLHRDVVVRHPALLAVLT